LLAPLEGRLMTVKVMDGREVAIWLIGGLAMIAATAVAASGLGALGVAIVLLPAAMIGYSAAVTAAATSDDRRQSAAIEQANAQLRRFVLGETSSLIGLAREQQHAIKAGYDGAIRAALEVAVGQERFDGAGLVVSAGGAPQAAQGGW
jgi:hypothetical protein